MKYRLILLVFLMFLVGGVYAADIVINIDKDKFDFNGHEEDIALNEDPSLEPKINELSKYSKNFKTDSSGNKGKIIVKESTGDIIIKTPSGEIYMKIPKGVMLREDKGNLLFSGFLQETSLKIGEFEVDSRGEFEASFSDQGGVQTIKLGKGDLKVGEESFLGIKDAEVRVNSDGEINFAIFESPRGGDYEFSHKGKRYEFEVGENGGRVLFDPEGEGVYGKNSELTYQYFEDEKQIKHTFSGKEITVKFAEDGIESIKIVKGVYEKRIFGVDQKFSSNQDFTVFLDGSDIKEFNGNAISIDDKNRKINMRGAIKANNLKGSLAYEGYSRDAYSEFYFDGLKKDGVPFIDVQKGIAEIDNEKHLIRIANGVAKLKILNGDRKFPSDFKFRVGNLEGFVDEQNNNYNLVSSIPGRDNIVVNVPLGSYSELSSKGLIGEQIAFEKTGVELKSRLTSLSEKISSGEFKGKELQALEQLEIINQYKLDLFEGKSLDDSISNLNKFFKKNLDPEIEITSRILLAEMRMTKAQGLTGEDASKSYEFARNSYQKNLDRLLGTPGNPGLIEKAKFKYSFDELDVELRKLRNLVDQNEIGLLNSFVRDSNKNEQTILKQDRFLTDYSSQNPESIRLAALVKLSRNPSGENIRSALQDLYSSEVVRGGDQSTQARINLELALIDNRLKQFREEGGKLLKDTENIYGKDYLNFLKDYGVYAENFNSPITAIRHQFFSDRTDGINTRQNAIIDEAGRRSIGLTNMRKLVGSGVDMQEYFQASNVERLQRVLDVNSLDGYVSPQQFRDYSDSLGLTFEASTIDSDTRKLYLAISKDSGDSISRKYSEDFTKAVLSMDSIHTTVSNDPVAFRIAGHGSNVKIGYTGDIPLFDAFRLDRFGEAIGKSTGDYAFNVADFATILAAPAGAGKLIAGSARFARGQQVLNSIRAGLTTETLTTAYLGESFVSSALGVVGDTGIILGASYGLSEDSSQFIDMVTMFGAVNTASRGVKSGLKSIGVFEDALGNKQTLGVVELDLYNNMKVSPNFKPLGNGVLLGKNGERFVTDIPPGLVEIDNFRVNSDFISEVSSGPVTPSHSKSVGDLFDARSQQISHAARNVAQNPTVPMQDIFIDPVSPPRRPRVALEDSHLATREQIENAIGQKVGNTFASQIHEPTGKDISLLFRETMAEGIQDGVAKVKPGGFRDLSEELADRRMSVEDYQGDPRKVGDAIEKGLVNLNPDSQEFRSGAFLARQGEGRTGNLYSGIEQEIERSFKKADLTYTEASNLQFSMGLYNEEGKQHFIRTTKLNGEEVVQYAVKTEPIAGIYDDDIREGIFLTHFRKEDKPKIARHLSSLNDRISSSNSAREQAKLISEFEWWWFSSNPTIRGGAAIGDSMSMIYQQHAGIPIRNGFTNQDYVAIGSNLDDYVERRTRQFIEGNRVPQAVPQLVQ